MDKYVTGPLQKENNMTTIITQLLEYRELVAIIIGLAGVYYQLDKRISKLEGWCNPFFGKMYEEAVERVLTEG